MFTFLNKCMSHFILHFIFFYLNYADKENEDSDDYFLYDLETNEYQKL